MQVLWSTKGATIATGRNNMILALDHYGDLIEAAVYKSIKTIPGAGAAGGLGFALLAIGANITSGAELLADAMNMEDAIRKC